MPSISARNRWSCGASARPPSIARHASANDPGIPFASIMISAHGPNLGPRQLADDEALMRRGRHEVGRAGGRVDRVAVGVRPGPRLIVRPDPADGPVIPEVPDRQPGEVREMREADGLVERSATAAPRWRRRRGPRHRGSRSAPHRQRPRATARGRLTARRSRRDATTSRSASSSRARPRRSHRPAGRCPPGPPGRTSGYRRDASLVRDG